MQGGWRDGDNTQPSAQHFELSAVTQEEAGGPADASKVCENLLHRTSPPSGVLSALEVNSTSFPTGLRINTVARETFVPFSKPLT